ncbi:MAG: hypothetical protein QOJ38_1312 [Solirubrobacterales bacterium]|jgi:CSLREA domain-containing protein|nr:hypothetical protein [Solirubrobacterales bacterium]
MQGGKHSNFSARSRRAGILAVLAASALLGVAPAAHAGTITVTTTDDELNAAGDCSLREAIRFANDDTVNTGGCTDSSSDPLSADTIVVPGGAYNLSIPFATGTVIDGDLDITENVTIVGAGTDATSVDGNGSVINDRVFEVTGPTTVDMSGLTIHDGASQAATDGGGILAAAGTTLNLNGVDFKRNTASRDGGGIFGDQVNLENGVVSNNKAAGPANGGGGIFATTLDLNTTTVSENAATAADGGGIFGSGAISGTVTLTNSDVRNNVAADDGGGIYAERTVDLISSSAGGNRSTDEGGGIRALDAVSLTDAFISGNTAATGGGAMALAATVTGSVISANDASTGDGGGLVPTALVPTTTVDGSIIRDNSAFVNGGGLRGAADLTDTTVLRNVAGGLGGGTFTDNGTLALVQSTIAGNDSGLDGGGVYLTSGSGGTSEITNTTISGNEAKGSGGGIATDQGTTELANVTINRNTADSDSLGGGAGGGIDRSGATATVNLRNTIIAGNFDPSGAPPAPDCSVTPLPPAQTLHSQGYNLIGVADACFTAPAAGDQFGTLVAPINPQLALLADNGGPTLTHALTAGSPAINAGNPATPGSGGFACEPIDQRGISRTIASARGRCDIGAFEQQFCRGIIVTRIGTNGADTINGTGHQDVILALGGSDRVNGRGGNDVICGGGGSDTILGGAGADHLFGEAGNDVLNGGAGSGDRCVGGPGRDVRIRCESA